MITLSKNGNAIRFTFVDNGHYLFNGTIDVPINSLSLITDESEMATFKKSATNDTFISALYSDFGMSKSELETWYMNNMVGSSGGSGSGGTTPEEVQQMIDESISGLAESSAVTLEISEAVSGKADSDSLATVATSGSYNDLLDKPTIPDVSNYFDGAEYDSGTTRINFYHGSTVKAYIDASAFIVDGMIDDVRIDEISGVTYLVIDFNTDSGKEDIQIPLTDIFDPSNYYTKSEVDDAISAATDDMATQTWVGEQGYLTEHQSLSAYSTTEEVNTAIEESTSGKADTSAVTAVNNVLTAHTSDADIHVTVPEKMTWNAKSDFSGSYNDLTDKPTIPTVPTNVSDFNNDAGYITSDALSGYAESSAVTEEISAAVSGKVDTTTYTAYTAATDTVLSGKLDASAYTPTDLSEYWTSAQTESAINAATSGKADTTAVTTVNNTLTAHTSDSDIHVTVPEKVAWNEKQDALVSGTNIKTINNQSLLGSGNITIQGGGSGSSTVELTQAEYDALVSGGTVDPTTYYIITDATPIDMSNYYTSAQTDSAISAATSGKADSTDVTAEINAATSGLQETLVSGTNIKTINNESILGSGNITIQGGGGIDSGTVQTMIDESISGKADSSSVIASSAITSAVTSASTDSEIPTAKAVYDATQSGGGGGTTYSAGTNISIDTANTISCTLPITANTDNSLVIGIGGYTSNASGIGAIVFPCRPFYNTNIASGEAAFAHGSGCSAETACHAEGLNTLAASYNSHAEGLNTKAKGNGSHAEGSNTLAGTDYLIYASHAEGDSTSALTSYSHAEGTKTQTKNISEHASGYYNLSVSASTTFGDSGNTLFSVGNGTADNARHNAFEIRQNGDIYITSGGTDIKLQDNLGGGSVSSAVTSGDTNAVSSDAVYTAMGGLKLQQITQADYDALVSGGTVDASTLYIITNVVN